MLESRLFRILDEVTTIIILNFIFLLCSLLIITIFPALFAMIKTIENKFVNKSSEVIIYFFKKLWKYKFSANLIGVPASIICFSLFYYMYAFSILDSTWRLYFLPISVIIFIIYVFFIFHLIFLFIHLNTSMKGYIKDSFLLVFYKPHITGLLGIYIFIIFLLTYHFQILLFLGTFSLPAYGLVYTCIYKLSKIKTTHY